MRLTETPTRLSLTERRAEDLRLEIARAALRLFVIDGDTSATVERISEAAGVAPRTFYRHFAVKEDVVLPLFRRSARRMAQAIDATDDAEDVRELLSRVFATQLDLDKISADERQFVALMLTVPAYRMRWMQADDELRNSISRLLTRHLGAPVDPFTHRLAADLVAYAARRTFEESLIEADPAPIRTMLRTAVAMVLDGLIDTDGSA